MSQQTGSNAIRLTQPEAGQTVNIPVNADDMRLSLGFAPDPNAVVKNGQDLEFGFEDGGKIVLEGYYDHFANKTLPIMVTESGDELSGEDFLASLNEDLLTAAGPGAGAGAAGSGAGEYADDPGALLGGVNRLGSLGTSYWSEGFESGREDYALALPSLSLGSGPGGSFLSLSAYGLNESQSGFSLYLNLSFPAIGDVTVSIQVGGNATLLQNAGSDQEFRSDFSIIEGPNYSYNPATGILTVTIPAGESSVEVPVNLIDDHINDSAKDIVFTVVGTEGPVLSSEGVTATVDISEDSTHGHSHAGDNEAYVYDGPIVGFDESGSATSSQEGAGDLNFRISFTDPHTGDNYEGFKGDNILSQDMTLQIAVKAPLSGPEPAIYGEDYEIDLDAIRAMDGVKSAEYDEASGTLTIELWGRVDENGNPHPAGSGEPFRFDGDGLSIPIIINDDTLSERTDENFELEFIGSAGNESMGEGSITGTIEADTRDNFNGPVLSLTVGALHESDTANDPYFAAEAGKTTHTIDLSKASTEDIKVWVSITDGSAKAGTDYDLPAEMSFIVSMADGSSQTVTGTLDQATGKYEFTIPEGAVKVEFDVNAIDNDLEGRFDSTGGVGEYTVGLGLVKTDASGNDENHPDYDPLTGLADGEATIGGTTDDVIFQTAQITEDQRTDGIDPLNPDYFDGPLVYFTGDAVVSESDGVTKGGLQGAITGDDAGDFVYAVYNIDLKSPNGDNTPYAAQEDVTVTFKLTLGSGISVSDINLNGLTYSYTDGSGTHTGPITVTGTAPEYTFSVTVPEGAEGVTFQIPVVDDHVGGYDDGSNISDAGESYKIEITGIEGNEARLPDSDRDGNYETDKVITTEIQDDAAATLDGPVIGAKVNTAPNGSDGAFKEGTQNVEIQLTLKDPGDDSGTADYKGYKNSGVLSEPMEITVTLEGLTGGSVYGQDYQISATQNILHDLVTNNVITGYSIDPATGSITISIPAGTNLQHLQEHLKIKVDILNDTATENGEGFKVVVDTKGNESQASGEALEVKIEDDMNGAKINIAGSPGFTEGHTSTLDFTLSCSDNRAPQGEVSVTLKFGGSANPTGGDPMDIANSEATSIDYKFQKWVDAMTAEGKLVDNGDGTFTLTLQPEDWTSTGKYTFGFESVEDMYREGNETITVEIVAVEGAHEETVGSQKTAQSTITDDYSVSINISDADQNIYEDAEHAAAEGGKTVAVHTITFAKHASMDGYTDLSGLKAVEDFTFQVQIIKGIYDADMTNDNDGTGAGAGDFRWAFQEALLEAGNPEFENMTTVTQDMIAKINEWMQDNGYLPADGSVTIIAVDPNGRVTFQVLEGYPLDASDIKLPVEAVDNFKTQGDHEYQFQIVTLDGKNETIATDTGKGTIIEETGDYLDGFRIGVEAQNVNESEGAKGFITLNLYDRDGNNLTGRPATPDGDTKITLSFSASEGIDPAEMFKDYRIENVTKVGDQWQLVITVTKDQWVNLGDGTFGVKIPVTVADNAITDGDRGFTVTIDKIEGNEATTLGGKESADVVITDDTLQPEFSAGGQNHDDFSREGVNVLDGPKLVGFYDNTRVIYGSDAAGNVSEPGAKVPADSAARTEITYTLVFDQVANEPILVAFDLGGSATYPDDFELGEGLVAVETGMTVDELKTALGIGDECDKYLDTLEGITFEDDGTITVDTDVYSDGIAFIAKVDTGQGHASFTVAVKPDHLSEGEEGSESIEWTIKDMQGSEVIKDGTYAANEVTVSDDGDGPYAVVTGVIDANINPGGNDTATFQMGELVTADEPYTITFQLVHGNNSPGAFGDDAVRVTIDGIDYLATRTTDSTDKVSYWEVTIPAGVSDPNPVLTVEVGSTLSTGPFMIGVYGTDGKGESHSDRDLASGHINYPSGHTEKVELIGGGAELEGNPGDPVTKIPFTVERDDTKSHDGDFDVEMTVVLQPGCVMWNPFLSDAENLENGADFKFSDNVTVKSYDPVTGIAEIEVTIPQGETSTTFTADFLPDSVVEGNDTFTVLVTGGDGITYYPGDAKSISQEGTIINDDFLTMGVELTLVDTVEHNGEEGFWEGSTAKLHVDFTDIDNADASDSLSNPITLTITYTPTGVDGAELGSDYVPHVFTVTVPAGTSIQKLIDEGYDFTVHLPDDATAGGNVKFDVTVEATFAGQGGPQTATDTQTVTILDDAGTDMQDGPKIVMNGYVENGKTGTSGMDYISENGGRIVVDFTTEMVPTEDVTITLQLSGLDRVKLIMADDGSGNQVPCVEVFDASTGMYKPVAVTFTDSPANTEGTIEVSLNAGDNKAGIRLDPLDDKLTNGNEVVKVEVIDIEGSEARIVDMDGNVVNDPAGAASKPGYEATIVDDATRFIGDGVDFAAAADGPAVSIALAPGAVSTIWEEGTQDTAFEVKFTKAGEEDTTVNLRITNTMLDRIELYDENGDPYSGGDTYMKITLGGTDQYVKVDANGNFSVEVPAGSTSFQIPVHLNDDLKTQSNSSFTIQITGVEGSEATVSTASRSVSTRSDNDGPQVSLDVDTASVIEGDTGDTTTVTYKLTLTQPAAVDAYQENMTVTLTLSGATINTDYAWDSTALATALSGYTYSIIGSTLRLTLTASQLDALLSGADGQSFTFDIPVTVRGDDKVEGGETFGMTVSTTGSESAVVGDSKVNVTITDDDHRPGEGAGGLQGETAIFMWDGSAENTTLKADVLYNDIDIDEDGIAINSGTGNDYRGDFSHSGGSVEFTFDASEAIFDTLPDGSKVTGNMGFDYSVKDEHGNVSTDTAHMDVEVHKTNSFDGSSYTNDLIIQGTGSDDHIRGGSGDDHIRGGSGDDYIRGGLGNDIMVGGSGENSFVWEVEDIASGGLDQILDFAYGADKLLFDDLLGVTADGFDGSTLTLTVTTEGSVEQTVVVNFESNTAFNDFVNNYNSSSESDQSVMLNQLINSITGN